MSGSERKRRKAGAAGSAKDVAVAAGKPGASGAGGEGEGKGEGKVGHPPLSRAMKMRGWVDSLVIAYVLAMFIRTYDVELFKIPTGSMTPTLVGDERAVEYDFTGDQEKDLILFYRTNLLQIFPRKNKQFTGEQLWADDLPPSQLRELAQKARARHDMILVNKFLYWFVPPKRGDIIVFKVPNRPELNHSRDPNLRNPWNPKTPIFIKRCAGLPGDHIHIAKPRLRLLDWPGGGSSSGLFTPRVLRLEAGPAIVNGEPLDDRPVFKRIMHFPFGFGPYNSDVSPQEFLVPEDEVFMMGDNAANSTDSRAWGGVPIQNIKGKAIFRYWPMRTISFLE